MFAEFSNELLLVGRLLFGGFFLMNGVNHMTKRADMAAYAGSKRVPTPTLSVLLTGAVLLLGGFGVIFGAYMEYALVALALFLVGTLIFMHRFWEVSDPQARAGEMVNFMKNTALIGAILMLLSQV